MDHQDVYYMVRKRALPEVLLKVAKAKQLLDSGKAMTVQEATEKMEISRSSFYKYKNDIFPFREDMKGMNLTLFMEMEDRPGLLSRVLTVIADSKANLLTIHQTIPIDGMATLTLTLAVADREQEAEGSFLEEIEALSGVRYVKVLSRERGARA